MEAVRNQRFNGLVSDVVKMEIDRAPGQIRELFAELTAYRLHILPLTEAALQLRDEYLKAGALTERWRNDAAHVALATLHEADALVSWNFKHLVRFDKIRIFNEVNRQHEHRYLQIISPLEIVIGDES